MPDKVLLNGKTLSNALNRTHPGASSVNQIVASRGEAVQVGRFEYGIATFVVPAQQVSAATFEKIVRFTADAINREFELRATGHVRDSVRFKIETLQWRREVGLAISTPALQLHRVARQDPRQVVLNRRDEVFAPLPVSV